MTPAGPTTVVARGSSAPSENPKPSWYRRRAVLVGCGVAAILAVTVISDLPQHTAIPQQISQENTVIAEIRTDAASCVYAVQEAFRFYGEEGRGALSDRAAVPALLRDDQGACSYTSESIFDLSNIEVPGTAAGREIGAVVNSVTLWVTSDALAAIEAIQTLTTDGANAQALQSLVKAEHLLASDRAAVASELAGADRALDGAHLQGPGLASLPMSTNPSA